ncbi:unnamed protein product [Oppiella nova]|uniref:RAP domain-containing protein n=1 Tax=Oppiella nova TaxID=334625 RepID=A0A7R9QD47_9ACAR|nr:unnamed protein product [Oppiella nova]CAG2162625.1 unnamed protein product [Oppiella nova]
MQSFKRSYQRLPFKTPLVSGHQILPNKWLISRPICRQSVVRVVADSHRKCWKRFASHQQLNTNHRLYPSVLIQRPDTKRMVFIDNENQFAFKVIESLISEESVDMSEDVVTNESVDRIIDKFIAIPPEEFRDNPIVINDLVRALKSLSLRQLLSVLESVTKWPILELPFDPLFYKVWSNIDHELADRLTADQQLNGNKDVEKYLLFGNMFYRLKTANIAKFNDTLVKRLSSPDFELNKTSILHLLFYANLHRTVDPKATKYIMRRMEALVNDMDLHELGVFCMTCFKTNIKLTDQLLTTIIGKSISGVSDETNNITRTAITKCIRHSYHFHFEPQFRQYIDKLKQLSTNSAMTSTHLLNLKHTAHICDKELMDQTFDKLYTNLRAFRLKDIERIFLCLSNFYHELDPKKVESICDELHTNADYFQSYQYPVCLLNILHYLAVLQFYPKLLLRHCFETSFLTKIMKYSRIDFQRHLLTTNTALSIERYEEFGDILVDPERVYRYHRWILTEEKQSIPYITKRHHLLNIIYMSLKSGLQHRVQLCHIFPFRSYPFVVIWAPNSKHFSLTPTTELKQNMFNDCIAINVLEINDYAIVDKQIKGSVKLENRLLERLGFKVVVMPWHHLTGYRSMRAKYNAIIKEVTRLDPSFG